MDPKEMTNEQILEEVERQAAGEEERFPWAMEWMARVARGSADQLLLGPALQRGGERLWPDIVRRFDAGELFGCQHLDFVSMLMVTQDELDADLRVWDRFMTAGTATVEILTSEKRKEISAFGKNRLLKMPSESRRRFVTPEGALRPLASFPKEVQDALARDREAFQTLQEKYGWWWATADAIERERIKLQYAARKEAP